MKFGIQLFGSMKIFNEDPEGFLRFLADQGYSEIEPCVSFGPDPMEEIPTDERLRAGRADDIGLCALLYHFGRYLLPPVWAFIPTTLDSSVYFSDSFSLPLIAPQLMIMNESPTGRLSYTAKLTYDYMKQYPVNDLAVTLRLPCTRVELSWSNWAGGAAVWYNNAVP